MNKRFTQTCSFQIDKDLMEELKYVSKRLGVNLYVILLAAFKVLLFRRSGQYDLCVATPNATFSDILAIRTSLNVDEHFDTLLQRVKEFTRQAYLHPEISFEEVAQSINKGSDKDSLYQYMFVLQNFAEAELNNDKFEESISDFGLTLSVTQTPDHLTGLLIFATHIYSEGLVARMAGHYTELLHSIAQHEQQRIGELPMLTREEHQLLVEFNDTQVSYPEGKTIVDLFEEQVKNSPDNIAIVFREEKLTYRQLNEKANQLAHYLRGRGVKEEILVPICIDRSSEMIVATLGIWKAGGAYVPIDTEWPSSRIKFFLKDTEARFVIGDEGSREKLHSVSSKLDVISINQDWGIIGQFPADNLDTRVQPQHLAYIIYTSGSTGKPKGVMVEHKSIYNYILNSREKFIIKNRNGSGTFVHLSYTFDASLKSMFTPLVAGKMIVISSKPAAYVFEDANFYKYAPFDFIQLTPSHLDFFYLVYKDEYERPVTGRISIGGEALYLSHFDYILQEGEKLEVINEYGPTEATVACSSYSFSIPSDKKLPHRLPVGNPISNVQIFVLNEYDQPVPLGVVGEICVGGVQVARGYLNSPELTKRKFIANPFNHLSGATIYKTGDMGRWLPDGNIEFLSRKDNQVKIRGYRVEPGEIESILIKSDMISQVAVVAKEDSQHVKHLVAYVVPHGIFDKKAIISYLQAWLPAYMVPDIWITQESLPWTPNGKIDRNILPEPDFGSKLPMEEALENAHAPRTDQEQRIAEIWQDVLGVKNIGINDNFFELGEPSLLAIKVLRLVEEVTGKYLPLSAIYEHPTIEEFVKRLNQNK